MTRSAPGARASQDRGQTETVATVLILAMTLIGATVALGFGASALKDARLSSQEQGIEHAMTQLDSRSAMVALGDSDAQQVPLASGSYQVDSDAGWVRVTHFNYSGTGSDEVVYNQTLGAIVYERDGETIAYQGGGVWKSAENASTMISPPEFHYRSATLTLPVIRVQGSGGVSGGVTARITSPDSVERIYPNESRSYSGGTPYSNPVSSGNVTVEVHSEYYTAWADYFRTRSDGEVTVFHSNNTVRLLLLTPSTLGDFQMPPEGNSIPVKQIGDDHPVNEFNITIANDPHFNNMHWGFYAEEGGKQLEIHIYSPGKCQGGPGGGSYDDELDISIYFYNGSGGVYEGWQNTSVDPDNTPDVNVDCSAGEMTINLLGTIPLTYQEISITGGDNKWKFGPEISSYSVADPVVLDQHPTDTAGARTGTYAAGSDSDEIGFLVNHYLQRMGPDFELRVTDGPGGSSRVDEDESSGTLDYDQGGGGKFITFLHITENRIQVSLD